MMPGIPCAPPWAMGPTRKTLQAGVRMREEDVTNEAAAMLREFAGIEAGSA